MKDAVFPFSYEGLRAEYSSPGEVKNYNYTWLEECVSWVADFFDPEEKPASSRRLLPQNSLLNQSRLLLGVPDSKSGPPDFRKKYDSQLRIIFPSGASSGFSFKVQYMYAYVGEAPGYCYRDGESAGSDRPKGLVVDGDGWQIGGSVKTYSVYLDGQDEPVLWAEDFAPPPYDYQRIPDDLAKADR